MCDLYDSLLSSEDKLNFKKSQTQQKGKSYPLAPAPKKTPHFIGGINRGKEKEIKREIRG